MAKGNFVSYLRVSTQKQGVSGLGLEAQREAVVRYLNGGAGVGELVGEYVEQETGKGADALAKRPQLRAALDACRKSGATLLIAKLDRLARNVHFITGLMEAAKAGKGIKFVACDLPEASDLTIHIMAAFAEHEAQRISERTKDALRAAKARGTVLGAAGPANLKPNIRARQAAADDFAEHLRGVVEGFRLRGCSQRVMVEELNRLGIPTARGGKWSLTQLQRVIKRQAVDHV